MRGVEQGEKAGLRGGWKGGGGQQKQRGSPSSPLQRCANAKDTCQRSATEQVRWMEGAGVARVCVWGGGSGEGGAKTQPRLQRYANARETCQHGVTLSRRDE
eukprot:165702-Chlamydomonas_euryale.AAC.1